MPSKFSSSTEDDINQIQHWTDADIYHRGQNSPQWWLTGNGLVSFRIDDGKGTVLYARLDDADSAGYARLSVQFAPEEVVSKRRLVRTILEMLPKVLATAEASGSKGLIFDSVSPTLVRFMERMGFIQIAEDDSYLLLFGE